MQRAIRSFSGSLVTEKTIAADNPQPYTLDRLYKIREDNPIACWMFLSPSTMLLRLPIPLAVLFPLAAVVLARVAPAQDAIDLAGIKTNYSTSLTHEDMKKQRKAFNVLAAAKGINLANVSRPTRVTIQVYVTIVSANQTESGGGRVT